MFKFLCSIKTAIGGLLAILLLISCQPSPQILTINFKPSWQEKTLNCSQKFAVDSWQISQLQLLLSEFEIQDDQDNWIKAPLIAAQGFSPKVALIGGICGDDFNWQLSLESKLDLKKIKSIKFSLGVPQQLNHLNPLGQPTPLNQPDMFWTWQSGYKYARIELANKASEWIFHLGATGCHSPSPVRAPKNACLNPNRGEIILDNFSPDKNIEIDLFSLLAGVNMVELDSCQSSQDNPLCQALFPRVGISASADAQQVLFKVSE